LIASIKLNYQAPWQLWSKGRFALLLWSCCGFHYPVVPMTWFLPKPMH